MKQVIVRYSVKADRLAEHEALIRAVFAELSERAPAGTTYQVLKLSDGLGFIHIAGIAGPENEIVKLDAFKAFAAGIKERCEEPAVSSEATVFATYGGLIVGPGVSTGRARGSRLSCGSGSRSPTARGAHVN